jgi:hypothetical protein
MTSTKASKSMVKMKYLMLKYCIIGLLLTFFVNFHPAMGQTEDVVILNEENEIIFTGESMEFIGFTVNKKVHYKINTQAGLEKMSKLVLPESFDPSYIAHFPKARNYQNLYTRMNCDLFKAEIKSSSGEIREAAFSTENEEVKMHMPQENYYGTYYKYIYKIEDIQIGDELIIEYSYNMLYNENFYMLSGVRIFFHSDIPKLGYHLKIQHHSELVVDYSYFNDAKPDSLIDRDGLKKYYWNRENLAACISEPGGKPYLSLPYIVLTPRPYDLLYKVPHSYEERLTPIYSLFAGLRETNHFSISISIMEGVNTRQYEQLNHFLADKISETDVDSIRIKEFTNIHNTIVDEFDFADDIDYFTREDRRNHRMGDYLIANQIRDISRYDVYLALIRSLGLKYFTTYLCDNRSGMISDNFLKPMFHSDFMYTILLDDGNAFYLYPKKEKFGYYMDEIPFYFENAKGRLVHLLDYRNTEEPISEEYREIILPKGSIGHNTRNSRLMVEVNLKELSATFNAKINLSGQFSTMTRGAYQYDYSDETANKLYGKKIWEIGDDVKVLSKDVMIKSREHPYPVEVRTKYVSNNSLSLSNDTLSLDVSNWFNHIIYHNFEIQNRQLDFYPDFAHRDTYSYIIKFDEDVKMLGGIESININDDLGTLIINAEQIDSKNIRITSHFAITDKIEVNRIRLIKDIYDKIEQLNQSSIKFLIVN